jgi:glycerophosphoryl diester phosphodiesterase
VRIPIMEEVYREFTDVRINVEIGGKRPGIEEALWRNIEGAGAEERTLVVSEDSGTIRRFRETSGRRVATASSSVELIFFWLLSRLRLSGLSKPSYQALQGPETYKGLRIVTSELIRERTSGDCGWTSGPLTTSLTCGGWSVSEWTAS